MSAITIPVTDSPVGCINAFAGINIPAGWLNCDGSSLTRLTYPGLFATLTQAFTGATTTSSSTTVSGLSGMSSATHVGWGIAGNGIPSGATISSVTNATTVVISAAATVTQTGTAALWIGPYGFTGANNTTTFLLPDLTGRVVAGKESTATRLTSAGSGITGSILGNAGGAQTHTLTAAQSGLVGHTHSNSLTGTTSFASTAHCHSLESNFTASYVNAAGFRYTGGGEPVIQNQVVNTYGPNASRGGVATASVGLSNASVSDATASSAHNNAQPTMVMSYIIKAM